MQFDDRLYSFDSQRQDLADASLEDGAFLYRITSLLRSDKKKILKVDPSLNTHKGRFHTISQPATYCANNVLVCIAEVLYHMHRRVLDGISAGVRPGKLAALVSDQRVVNVLAVSKIRDMVYADSKEAAAVYNSRITGPSITCPDKVYDPLHIFSDAVRADQKKGIVYPSARHSRDIAFVFFEDETRSIKPGFFEKLQINLHLIAESQDLRNGQPPPPFRVFQDKLHPTMGYYEFKDEAKFKRLKAHKQFNPSDVHLGGYVDFVRRRYDTYPDQACIPVP